ncbi:MAG: hypothetical protein CNLJKLNK_00487 [Holosporales bacterium]
MKKNWILALIINASAILSTKLSASESVALTPINTNVQPSKIVVTHPTCLNPEVSSGYSLEKTLELNRNCLQSFMQTFRSEISSLYKLGLFTGRVKQYNIEVMNILHSIFSTDSTRSDNIVHDFNRWNKFLFADMEQLAILVREKEKKEENIRELLNQIEKPLIKTRWCMNHYLNNYKKFITEKNT